VLIVHRLSHEGYRYYLAAVGPDPSDAPARGETPGRWIGQGAERHGLSGVVHAADLREVLRTKPGGIPGYDLTFAAPKSVSVLHGLGSPALMSSVRGAHDAAVAAGLGYLERQACVVRADGVAVPGDGYVVAAFRHRVSRADDPHLHTHALVANHALAPDGRRLALHGTRVYDERRGAAAIYHGVLRYELSQALGVTWTTPVGGRADIEQVPPDVRAAFSQRRAAMQAVDGPARWAERVTRPERHGLIDIEEIADEWRRRIDWRPPELGRGHAVEVEEHDPGLTTDRWTRADVMVALADRWVDGAPAHCFDAAAEDAIRVAVRFNSGHVAPRYATPEAVARRRDVDDALMKHGPIDAHPAALDRLRRHLANEKHTLVVMAPDRSAADALHWRTAARAAAPDDLPGAGLGAGDVVAVVRAPRIDSQALAALIADGHARGFAVVAAIPRPHEVLVERGLVATVSTSNGDVTAAATATLAASTALVDWAAARAEGRPAVLVAAPAEIAELTVAARTMLTDAGLRSPPEMGGFASGDAVRFAAAKPSHAIRRDDVGTVLSVGAGRINVDVAGRAVALRESELRSVVSGDVVVPVARMVAGRGEAFVVGGGSLPRSGVVVHRYVTVDANVIDRQPNRWRHATLARLDMERPFDGPARRAQSQLRRAALEAADDLDGRRRQRVRSVAHEIAFGGPMLLGQVSIQSGGQPLPGTAQLNQLISGFDTWALMAALAGMLVGAAVWALGHHTSNYQQSLSGRKGLMVSAVAALVLGAAPTIINFLFGLGGQVRP
jgi:conjugative relaxase-like TrwC/TraI family protein